MDFKHEIIGFKHQGDKNHVDENVSDHGMSCTEFFESQGNHLSTLAELKHISYILNANTYLKKIGQMFGINLTFPPGLSLRTKESVSSIFNYSRIWEVHLLTTLKNTGELRMSKEIP